MNIPKPRRKLRMLVACEYSGTVRDAFARLGWDAWSCDIIPSEAGGKHLVGNVLNFLDDNWDLMVAHPPCTYLSYVGLRHWNNPGRAFKREGAFRFFMALANCSIPRICIENPRGLPCKKYRKPDQVVEPYYFGDSAKKLTCIWLKNLPPLQHSQEEDFFIGKTGVEKPAPLYFTKTKGKAIHFTEGFKGEKDRGRGRSRFWNGIANAMAKQWTEYIYERTPEANLS